MTGRAQLALASLAGLAAGLLVGFFSGVRVGITQYVLSEGAPRAMILTTELDRLRRGKTDNAIELMEGSLDDQVLLHGHFMNRGRPWIMYPLRTTDGYDSFMQKVAQYRRKYPRARSDLGKGDPKYDEVRAAQDEIRSAVQQVLDRYAK